MADRSIAVEDVPGLAPLVEVARREGEVILTIDGEPVARIVALRSARARRSPGSHRGAIIHMADDFDATPDDFRDYT